MVSAVGKTDFDAFIDYDTELSARKTKVVLGVFREKDSSGVQRQVLKVVNLNDMSFFQRIYHCFTGAFSKKNVGNFLSLHMDAWSKERVRGNEELQLQVEKQCAKLSRKITFIHKYQWPLQVTLQYPSSKHPDRQIEETKTLTFDRLTTNKDLVDATNKLEYSFRTKRERKLTVKARAGQAFAHVSYKGDIQGNDSGSYLQDSEKGKERSCTVTFSEPRQRYIAECTAKAFSRDLIDKGVFLAAYGTITLPLWGIGALFYIPAALYLAEGILG